MKRHYYAQVNPYGNPSHWDGSTYNVGQVMQFDTRAQRDEWVKDCTGFSRSELDAATARLTMLEQCGKDMWQHSDARAIYDNWSGYRLYCTTAGIYEDYSHELFPDDTPLN